MKILAMETSTARTEVVLIEGATVGFAEHVEAPRRETGPLFSLLDDAVALGGRPDRVVVGVGPGSYNGIRAGIATAEALGMGFAVPVVGVCSLRGYGFPDHAEFAVVGDARSQQFYFARIRDGELIEGPILLTPAEAVLRVGELPVTGPAPLPEFPQLVPAFPSAARLAEVARTLDPADHPPEPLYLKPAHITPKSPKA